MRLRPPDLVVQDELHLITDALGSLFGLYETAVDRQCTRWQDGSSCPTGRRSVDGNGSPCGGPGGEGLRPELATFPASSDGGRGNVLLFIGLAEPKDARAPLPRAARYR